MLYFVFDFPARRYHATPWGHHVNEGLVEWPPSPWRIVRALIATGYTKFDWQQIPDEMRQLVEALAAVEPTYRLPAASQGHTRHYMPVKGWKKGVQATSLVIDAFVRPEGSLGIEWPAEVKSAQRDLLSRLLDRLGYLGRAESRVKAQLVSEEEVPLGMPVSTQRREPDDEPVRLLGPVAIADYEAWRQGVSAAPDDLLAALCLETTVLQKEGWTAPPGSREIIYWRPAAAFLPTSMRGALLYRDVVAADTALFALSTDQKRDVLPLMERALPTMELFRRALLSKVGNEQQHGRCPELTGKDEHGEPLRDRGHGHAHFIPLSLDARNRGRIDHVLVHSPMGFQALAQHALRRLRKTWAKNIESIAVTLVGIGPRELFVEVGGRSIPELAMSATWASRTPFIPTRYLKSGGKNTLEAQVRAELHRRGLPDLSAPPLVTAPTGDDTVGRLARRFRHFARTRRRTASLNAADGSFHLTLTLERPISGPLCLGWGSHFGLGVFAPKGNSQIDP